MTKLTPEALERLRRLAELEHGDTLLDDGPASYGDFQSLLSAYEAMLPRPIEEAPRGKDFYSGASPRILAIVPPYGWTCAHFDLKWHCHSVLNKEAQPTHFIPLDALPQPTEESETE